MLDASSCPSRPPPGNHSAGVFLLTREAERGITEPHRSSLLAPTVAWPWGLFLDPLKVPCDGWSARWMSEAERVFCVYNITVGRLGPDADAQGVIKPSDGSWQLVIDKDGVPHLWLSTLVEDDDGRTVTGMVPLDLFLAEGATVANIMGSVFRGAPSAEEAAIAEDIGKHGLSCPSDG